MPDENGNLTLEEMQTIAAGGTVETPPADGTQPPADGTTPPADGGTETPPADGGTETPPADGGTEPPADGGTEPPADGGTETPPADGNTETPPADANNPIRDLRNNYNTVKSEKEMIDNTIKRLGSGKYDIKLADFLTEEGAVDYAAMSEAMDAADTAVRAEERGVTPEIQAELERIEKEKIEIQKERLQVQMQRSLNGLQIKHTLSSKDVNVFFKDSLDLGKNPYNWLAQGGDIEDLYDLVYKDRIQQDAITAAVAAARAEWEEEMRRAGRVPTPNPAGTNQQTGTGGNKDGLSLDDLLTEAASKVR